MSMPLADSVSRLRNSMISAARFLPAFSRNSNPNFPVCYSAPPPVREFLQVPSNMRFSCLFRFWVEQEGIILQKIRSQHIGSDDRFFKDQERAMRASLRPIERAGGSKPEERAVAIREPLNKR